LDGVVRVIVDCGVYENGIRRPGTLAVDLAFDALEELEGKSNFSSMVWIELMEPNEDEVALVAQELLLHPLVREDVLRAHQRPKLEVYPSSAFIVMKSLHVVGNELTFGELSMVVGERFIVTVRHGVADPVTSAKEYLHQRPEFLARGPSAVLYALADAVVDSYESACDGIELAVDDIEDHVFSESSLNAGPQIFSLKRSTLTFLRNVLPLGEVLHRVDNGHVPFTIPDEVEPYLRDVSDHLRRMQSRLEQSRDLLGAALELNHAQIGIRQNEDMRAMAGWAAIIAVPTLLAGIWGMNFQHMPELGTRWGYLVALCAIVASSYSVYRILKRNGWM
jgi:magnesium transporter